MRQDGPPGLRRGWLSAGALLVGLGGVGFAVRLASGDCGSCAGLVPPGLVAFQGAAWILVAGLVQFRAAASALGLAAFLLAAHSGVLLFAASPACPMCWTLFAGEAAVTALLALRGPWRSATVTAMAASGLIGLSGSFFLAEVVLPPQETRELAGTGNGMTAYIIVRRNCGKCRDVERHLSEALRDGLPAARALIVDERSPEGRRFVRRFDFDVFPSFVATRGTEVVQVQAGGGIERFMRTLSAP